MDKMKMRIMGAETEFEYKQKCLQSAIEKLVELVQKKDISETAFYNAYVAQTEDVRRYANETATAKRVCEVLKAVQA
jgi:hypothetical protein